MIVFKMTSLATRDQYNANSRVLVVILASGFNKVVTLKKIIFSNY